MSSSCGGAQLFQVFAPALSCGIAKSTTWPIDLRRMGGLYVLSLMIFFKQKGLQLPLRRGEADIRVYDNHVLRGSFSADVLIELLAVTLESDRVRQALGDALRERLPIPKKEPRS